MPILGLSVLNYVDRSSPALESEVLIGRSCTPFISPSLAQHDAQHTAGTQYTFQENARGCPRNIQGGLPSACVTQLRVDSPASSVKGDAIFYLILYLPCLEYHDCPKYILYKKKRAGGYSKQEIKLHCLWPPYTAWTYLHSSLGWCQRVTHTVCPSHSTQG